MSFYHRGHREQTTFLTTYLRLRDTYTQVYPLSVRKEVYSGCARLLYDSLILLLFTFAL